ncbi:uncharacterized protein LOC122088445 isoform X2 [Macadamia integrifolia]|uniref:uncharacterized protein LOC122088445 isoform X2 n=1 Tax=Macadamia integrifolia TaxID=60698 RepID=UPI001C4F1289|nr:uncharacterized protein LOC122088445 isoform X2 [Macadamia integrifolia]
MGTREVYEQKLRSGNLYHDPTINPGLGTARCPRCLSLLNPHLEKGEWNITSVLHDAAAVAGSGAGAMLSAVHGFNTGIPFVQKHVKGPKSFPFLIGVSSISSSSIAIVFRCKCCIWRLCSSKICAALSDILLCCLKCLTLCNIAPYQVY